MLATKGDLEIAFDGVVEISDEVHDQLRKVVVGLRQNVIELEQQVKTYGSKQGEILPPLCDNASVSCDAHVGALFYRCTQTAWDIADAAEGH